MADKKRGRPKKPGKPNAFKKWMETNSHEVNAIADDWDISRSFIYGMMNGSQKPGREMALFIRNETSGVVAVDSW